MTLIALESFDSFATAHFAERGWTISGTPEVSAERARTGPNSLKINTNSEWIRRVLSAAEEHATIIVGAAIYIDTLPISGQFGGLFSLRSDGGSTNHVNLGITGSGGLEVRRGSVTTGTILATAGSLNVGIWYYVELRVTLSDTVGVVEVRVNNTSRVSSTNLDTKNLGTKTVFDTVGLASDGATVTAFFDDVYICNAAGSVNNTFLNDLRVRCLLPNANGNSSQLLGSDGNSVDNYLLVDDPTPDTADYVGSATLNQKDTYNFQNLPETTGEVKGVQISAHALKTDTGVRNLALVTRSGGADYDSADLALGTASLFYQTMRELDPATAAAWTRDAVNNAEFGVKVR